MYDLISNLIKNIKKMYQLINIKLQLLLIKAPLPRDIFETISFVKRCVLFFSHKPIRILGIMDFDKFNFALGDITIFHENLIILSKNNNDAPIDICIVEDLSIKTQSAPKKDWAYQTLRLNPYIDNLFEFNDRSKYNRFRLKKLHEYSFFPNRRDQLHCDHRPLFKYYDENGSLPKMSADNLSLDWARNIIQNHVGVKKLIVVHIRNSMMINNPEKFANSIKGKKGAALRNSNLPEWQKFFENLDKKKYQVICVCTKDEIVTSWRENDLVLFSKDLGSDIMKDFALIQCSYLSLCPPSGMFEFSCYCGTPSYCFKPPMGYWKKKNHPIYQLNGGIEDYKQNNYQSPYQKLLWGEKDTFKIINYYFNELVEKLDNNHYDNEYHNKINNI